MFCCTNIKSLINNHSVIAFDYVKVNLNDANIKESYDTFCAVSNIFINAFINTSCNSSRIDCSGNNITPYGIIINYSGKVFIYEYLIMIQDDVDIFKRYFEAIFCQYDSDGIAIPYIVPLLHD